jgi:hypothetical protein
MWRNPMRYLGIDDEQMMRLARERAGQLRRDWLLANGSTAGRESAERAGSPGFVARLRLAAGRRVIGGAATVLRQSEPCA